MAACELEIRELVKSIRPTRTQINGAKRSHIHLRKILNTGRFENRIIKSYLSGSYARETAIYPLDDVDVIFEIDHRHWESPIFRKYPDPEVVLKSFHRAIKGRYQETRVRLQRRSVGLRLSHLDIDVVPAISAGKGRMLLIPDRAERVWIPTAPQIHSEAGIAANKFQDKLFKPLVKLLKFWNSNIPSTARLKSFTIETIAIRVFSNVKFETLQEGLKLYFDFLVFLSGGECVYRWSSKYGMSLDIFGRINVPDVASTGSNVASGLDKERLKRFFSQSHRSLNKMLKADDASSPCVAWRRVSEALKIGN